MAEETDAAAATIMLVPDLSNHPGPITRAQLVLEVGPHRIESRRISAAHADRTLQAMLRAFRGQIVAKPHGLGLIM